MTAKSADDFTPRPVRVRLVRKLADVLDGVDLSRYVVGNEIEVHPLDAALLIAEGWAVAEPGEPDAAVAPLPSSAREPLVDRVRALREQIERDRRTEHERRRAEDRIREELRDQRARTVPNRDVR